MSDTQTSHFRIESIDDFLPLIRSFYGSGNWGSQWIFRGQSKTREEWPLIPKAGRYESGFFQTHMHGTRTSCLTPNEQEWKKLDRYGYTSPPDMRVFSAWCNQAIAYINLPDDEWERLALAQHYDLATRLLDWTKNPLVALFFAACNDEEKDGAVYAIDPPGGLVTKERFEDIKEIKVYEPKPIDRRILAQQGIFTYHQNPLNPLTPVHVYASANRKHEQFGTNLGEIIVPAGCKRSILEDLSVLGISRSFLFPNLEGLSWELNRRNRVYFTISLPANFKIEPGDKRGKGIGPEWH